MNLMNVLVAHCLFVGASRRARAACRANAAAALPARRRAGAAAPARVRRERGPLRGGAARGRERGPRLLRRGPTKKSIECTN